jgi:transcriptional regulator with XRE-family HTH domain
LKVYDYFGKKNICGDKIREIRNKKRMSQSELAAQVQLNGITLERDSISRIEIGTRFVSDFELMVFAVTLGVTPEYLISEYFNAPTT